MSYLFSFFADGIYTYVVMFYEIVCLLKIKKKRGKTHVIQSFFFLSLTTLKPFDYNYLQTVLMYLCVFSFQLFYFKISKVMDFSLVFRQFWKIHHNSFFRDFCAQSLSFPFLGLKLHISQTIWNHSTLLGYPIVMFCFFPVCISFVIISTNLLLGSQILFSGLLSLSDKLIQFSLLILLAYLSHQIFKNLKIILKSMYNRPKIQFISV